MVYYITKQINSCTRLTLITLFFTTPVLATDNFTIENKFSIFSDSNVLRQANKVSDTAFVYSPEINFTGLLNKYSVELNYNGDFNKFNNNDQFDYNRHRLNLTTKLDITSKLTSNIRLGYQDTIEQPGITDTTTDTLLTFNKFNRKTASFRLLYGNRQSIGQVTLGVQYNDLKYTNNDQEFRDYKSTRITSTFYYRIASKTRLLLQASFNDLNYNDRVINNALTLNQSSQLNVFSTGIEWAHSVKFQGMFTIGYQSQNYEDSNFNDIDGLSYLLDTTWQPNTYTRITLSAERVNEESALINSSAFIANSYELSYEHNISEKTNVIANFSLQNDDIVSINERTDKRNTIELGVQHDLRTWLTLGLNLKREERKSDISTFEFDANIAELSINIKLD